MKSKIKQKSTLEKFINILMVDGKKVTSEKIVSKVFLNLKKELGMNPLEVFLVAIENVKPLIEVRPRRIAGKTYQIPMEISPNKQLNLAIKWIIESARNGSANNIVDNLTVELRNAYEDKGSAVRKKQDLYKLALVNRAFTHYRW